MLSPMGLVCVYLKVGDSVVRLVSVFMMNDFVAFQWPSDMFFHDNSMLASIYMRTRGKHDIAKSVVSLSCFEVCMADFFYDFSMQASTAFRPSLAQRFSFDQL
jgi:hypothetical protein